MTRPIAAPLGGRAVSFRGLLGLAGLVSGLVAGVALLLATAGAPRLPHQVPSWDAVVTVLSGAAVPWETLEYVLSAAAWALWLWIVLTLTLRVFVAVAGAVTHGAAWVSSLSAASDRVTLPFVRRVADGVLVAGVVVALAGRAGPAFAAEEAPITVTVLHAGPEEVVCSAVPSSAVGTLAANAGQPRARAALRHTVVAGDNLWRLSERYYGSGEDYNRIVVANVGRHMPDGRRFTSAGVIQPGWVLEIPSPQGVTVAQPGEHQATYVVSRGDTLSGVATSVLHDGTRWPELFALNQGTARLTDGRVLTQPNLIWPGLNLRLPADLPSSSGVEGASLPEGVGPAETATLADVAAPQAVVPDTSLPPETPADQNTEVSADEPPAVTHPVSEMVSPVEGDVLHDAAPVSGRSAHAEAGDDIPTQPAPSSRTSPGLVGSRPFPPVPAASGTVTGAAGAVIGAAGALFLVTRGRRRFRRSLDEPPVSDAEARGRADVPISGGFAQAELERVFAHRVQTGEVEPAVLIVERVLRLLREHGLDDVAAVTVAQGRSASGLNAELTMRASPGNRERLAALSPQLAERLGGACTATATADDDIVLSLTDLRPARLLLPLGTQVPFQETLSEESPEGARAAHLVGAGGVRPHSRAPVALTSTEPVWVPLGLNPDGATLYGNWGELGHVLLAGVPGGGTGVVMESVVAALASRRHPRTMHLVFASWPNLPSALRSLPHHRQPHVPSAYPESAPDPASFMTGGQDTAGATEGAEPILLVHQELLRRARLGAAESSESEEETGEVAILTRSASTLPDILLVVGELADVNGHDECPLADALHAIAAYGPSHGISLLAATTRPDAVSDSLLAQFRTRLVFQTATEDDSVLLLGQPDAADLGGGRLLISVDGRIPERLNGFQVTPARLAHLVRLMRNAYGSRDDSAIEMSENEAEGPAQVELRRTSSDASDARHESRLPVTEPTAPMTRSSDTLGHAAATGATVPHSVAGVDMVQASIQEDPRLEQEAATLPSIDLETRSEPLILTNEDEPQGDAAQDLRVRRNGHPHADTSVGMVATVAVRTATGSIGLSSASTAGDLSPSATGTGYANGHAGNDAVPHLNGNGSVLPTPQKRSHPREREPTTSLPGEPQSEIVSSVAVADTDDDTDADALALTRLTPHAGYINETVADDADGRRVAPLTPVYIRCFGELEISDGGRLILGSGDRVPGGAPHQAREVLAFLACQPGSATTKERLLDALWPDVDLQRGSKRLTVTLVRVRQWLEDQLPALRDVDSLIVRCDRNGTCLLDADVVSSDVQQFLSLIRTAGSLPPDEAKVAYSEALALYTGDLLTQPPYGWVDERGEDGVTLREHHRELHRRATLELARLHDESGDLHLAVPLYKSLLRAEPVLEDVVRLLYRSYRRLGDRTALVLEDRRLRQALKDFLSDPDDPDEDSSLYAPQPETVALYEQLLAELDSRSGVRVAS